MLTKVRRNPAQVCSVSMVPTDSGSLSSAMLAENCAESAIIVMPQMTATTLTIHGSAPSNHPIASAQAPLAAIEAIAKRRRIRNVLDLGTGSAVLAIALAKLAHIPVLATDIDPVATRVAAANARLNEVSRYIETRTAPGFHDPVFSRRAPFDLIVANILARPLMRMAPDMARSARLGGSLILSGILERQRNAVLAAYAGQQLRHVRTLWRNGWVTIHLKR